MKFVSAFVVITLIGAILGLGILVAAHGHGFWLLALATIAFLGLFIRYGCLGH